MVQLPGCSLLKSSVHRQHWPISKKVKLAVQSNPPNSPCCKTQGGFFSFHHLLSVRVILSKTMPAVNATFAALWQPLEARYITAACAPHRCRLQRSSGRKRPPLYSHWGSQHEHCMACSLQTAGNGFLKLNHFSTSTALERTASPINISSNQLSMYHHCQPDNSDHFYITEVFLHPQGFRQLSTPSALETLSHHCNF